MKSENKNDIPEQTKSLTNFENIKSKHILKLIFNILSKKNFFEIISHNKKLQNILNINIKHYEDFTKIELEIIPSLDFFDKNIFINIPEGKEKKYYHIYFNDNKEEAKRNYFISNEKVTKIKIIIDYQITSFYALFRNCKNIISISFKKFNRKNITDMSYMFSGCSSLKKINLSNSKTTNLKYMDSMFWECSSLEEIEFNNFITDKVINMEGLFDRCLELKKLNLSSFNTNNVINMRAMFTE